MRITVGDMELVITDLEERYNTYPDHAYINTMLREQLNKTVSEFLGVAERCYVARYGTKPERSTVDEF